MSMKRQLKSSIFYASLLAILSGCLPAFYTYWAPAAQDGRLFNSAAAGSIAPSNAIEYSFNGVRIQISGNGTGVGVSVLIPQGDAVSFLSDMAEVYHPALSKIKFKASHIYMPSLKRIYSSPTDILTADAYNVDIEFGGPERAQYRIRLPSVKVNGRVFNIPEITFSKKKGLGIFGP